MSAKVPMTQVIDLVDPVKVDGVEVASLTMRMPRTRDLRFAQKVPGDGSDQEVHLFAALCNVSTDTIDDLALPDYEALQSAYKGFQSPAGKRSGSPNS